MQWSVTSLAQNLSTMSIQHRVGMGHTAPIKRSSTQASRNVSIKDDVATPSDLDEGSALLSEDLSIMRQSEAEKRKQGWTIERTGIAYWSIGTIFGKVNVRSVTQNRLRRTQDGAASHDKQPKIEQQETTLEIYPATWLLRLGFCYGLEMNSLTSSTHGWKQTLFFPHIVPDDAPIFQLCVDGDLDGVRKLLSEGSASVRDTDEGGSTPLHVSCASRIYLSTCRQYFVTRGGV